MANVLRGEWKVPTGGVLLLTLVTPEPVTPEQTSEFARLVEAVEWSRLAGPELPDEGLS